MIATAGLLRGGDTSTPMSYGGTAYRLMSYPTPWPVNIKLNGIIGDRAFIRRKYDVVIMDYKLRDRTFNYLPKVFPNITKYQLGVIRQPPHRVLIYNRRT